MIFTFILGVNLQAARYHQIGGYDNAAGLSLTPVPPRGGTIIPVAGTFDLLYLNGTVAAPAGGATLTMTLNGVATAITITVAAGGLSGSDLTHSFHCHAGDVVSYLGDPITTWTGVFGMTCRFTPD